MCITIKEIKHETSESSVELLYREAKSEKAEKKDEANGICESPHSERVLKYYEI